MAAFFWLFEGRLRLFLPGYSYAMARNGRAMRA